MTLSHAWSGAVTSTSATVFVRSTGASVLCKVADNPEFTNAATFGPATPDSLNNVTFNVTGLDPDRPYWYAFDEDGTGLDLVSTIGQFRTHATLGEPASYTVALGSCAGLNTAYPAAVGLAPHRVSNHPVFDTIRGTRPLFFAHLGDMHYYDAGSGVHVPDASVGTYRDAYDTVHSCERQSRLYRSAPIVYVWDDHDYGPNNSDGTFADKVNAAQVYRERVPSYPLAETTGSIYHSFQIGRVLFVVSDTRYNRSPNSDPDGPSKTMLGTAQKTWLDNLLASSSAEALVWLMPTPWMGRAADTWAGFATERDELVTMLGDHGWLDRMCMFNGDLHALGFDDGGGNTWGGFPVYVIGSLDSGPAAETLSDPTHQYNMGPTSPGRNRWGSLRVVDRGHSIDLVGAGYIGRSPLHVNTLTVQTSTPVVFTGGQMPWKVEIAPGGLPTDPSTWQWEDISSFWRVVDSDISISHGRGDEWSEVGPTTCSLTLDNRDGRFSARNPLGPWFGKLDRNTPLRVSWDGLANRFVGFVTEWPVRWDKSGKDSTAPIRAAGILRRLGQGEKALKSALFRQIMGGSSLPAGYWPLEDEEDSRRGADAVTPLPGMRFINVSATGDDMPAFGSNRGPAGTAGGVELPFGWAGRSKLSFPGEFDAFTIEWWALIPENAATTETSHQFVLEMSGETGAWNEFVIGAGPNNYDVAAQRVESDTGATTLISGIQNPTTIFGVHHWALTFEQVGDDYNWAKYLDGELVDSGTQTGDTLSRPVGVRIFNGTNDPEEAAVHFSHIAVWPRVLTALELEERQQAGSAFAGERAGDRIARLCAEESVPYYPVSGSAETMPLGPQQPDTLLNLLREAEAADGGVLYEVDGGLSYLARADRYNLPVALSLSVSDLADAPEPTDDDQMLRNDVTAQRKGGSSGRVVDEESVAAQGQYDEQISVNVATDDVLNNVAGWRVHLGTVDEMRWPVLPLNLVARPNLIQSWLDLSMRNNRVTVDHAIPQIPSVKIDVLADGWSEELNAFKWDVEMNAVPASPWRVGVLDDDELGRLDTAGSSLVSAITSTDTSLSVATSEGPVWTTDPSEMPFDIKIGGEVMTVTDIGPSFADTFTRDITDGWGTADSGHAWSTAGGAASDYSTTLGIGRVAHTDVATRRYTFAGSYLDVEMLGQMTMPPMPTGAGIIAGFVARYASIGDNLNAWLRFNTDGTITMLLLKRVNGIFTQLTTRTLPITVSPGVQVWLRFRVAGSTLKARAWQSGTAEHPTWDVSAIDSELTSVGAVGTHSVLLTGNTNTLPVNIEFDNLSVINPQTFTVVRGVNGISTPHNAGADVRLAQPMILAL